MAKSQICPSTFSIVGYDPDAQEWGIAVQSKFLAVGAVVPWALAGVGAVATQSYANTSFGPQGLDVRFGIFRFKVGRHLNGEGIGSDGGQGFNRRRGLQWWGVMDVGLPRPPDPHRHGHKGQTEYA